MERYITIAILCLATFAGTARAASPVDTIQPPGTWVKKSMQCISNAATCAALRQENLLISDTRCVAGVGSTVTYCWVMYRDCSDNNPSTYDTYNAATAACVHYPTSCPACETCAECFDNEDCADGDPCTTDTCNAGTCDSVQITFGTSSEGCCVAGENYVEGESYCGLSADYPEESAYMGNRYTCVADGIGGHRLEELSCGHDRNGERPSSYCESGLCLDAIFPCQTDSDCSLGHTNATYDRVSGCDQTAEGPAFWTIFEVGSCTLHGDGTRSCATAYPGYQFCGDSGGFEANACECAANGWQ